MSRTVSVLADNRCLALLVSLVVLLVLGTALRDTSSEWLIVLFHSAVALAAVIALTYRRLSVIIGVIIGAPYFLATWAHTLLDFRSVDYTHELSASLFYLYVMFAVLAYVGRGRRIRRDDLFGAVAAYILLGLAWCYVYAMVQRADPDAFVSEEGSVSYTALTYFSFTTLTTLGYGDITPRSDVARTLSILEAMTGMMFVAIVVARMIAAYGLQRTDDEGGGPSPASPE